MNKLNILLADDHQVFREGLALLINHQPDMKVIGEAGTGEEVLRQVRDLEPDVVVMDLSMPGMNGLQATQALRARMPQVKVLVLTVHEDPSYLRQMCKADAAGYVLKRSAGRDLVDAIRKVALGEFCFDAALAGKALAGQLRNPVAHRNSPTGDLSEREKEVLRLVAWGHSNKEIASRLSLSVKTVETYKIRAADKLGLASRTEVVQFAVRQGWMNEMSAASASSPSTTGFNGPPGRT